MRVQSSINVLFILVYVVTTFLRTSALPEICRYGKRQMTIGQTYTNCYIKLTCYAKGVMTITESCRYAHCVRPSMRRGYKQFNSRKPYPECCAAPICEDGRLFYDDNPVRIIRPKRAIRRSPHVMGIKFASAADSSP